MYYHSRMKKTKYSGVIESEEHLKQIVSEYGANAVFGKKTLYLNETGKTVPREYDLLYCKECKKLIYPGLDIHGIWKRAYGHNEKEFCNVKCLNAHKKGKVNNKQQPRSAGINEAERKFLYEPMASTL